MKKVCAFKLLLAVPAACTALLSGCASSTPATTPTAAPLASGGASTAYVLQQASVQMPSVLGFPATGNGSVAPTTLSALIPVGYLKVTGMTTDSTGQIYMGGTIADGSEQIQSFAPGLTGTQLTTREFFAYPSYPPVYAMTTDSTGQLYVAGAYNISVFPPTANVTNATLLRIVSLPTMQVPTDVAVDTAGNLYVSCNSVGAATLSGSIFVFAPGASGPAVPSRTITSEALFAGLAVDGAGDIFAVENTAISNAPGVVNTEKLVEFAPSATGAATPIKTISGSATGMTFGGAVRVDSVGNLYLVNISITGTTQAPTTLASILTFGPTASGNEPPAGTMTSSTWNSPGLQLALK